MSKSLSIFILLALIAASSLTWLSLGSDQSRAEIDANMQMQSRVVEFLNDYFSAIQSYSSSEMLSMISRRELEENYKSILSSSTFDAMVASAMLSMNAEFVFAGICEIHVLYSGYENQHIKAKVLMNRSDHAVRYDFFIVEELGKLRVDYKIFKKRESLPETEPDIDVCDVPINWENPSILKDGESLDAQRKRLGFPDAE